MYPPLDPRLLEARAAALTLAVTHLALIARYEYGGRNRALSFIDKALTEMDTHLLVSYTLWTIPIKNASKYSNWLTKYQIQERLIKNFNYYTVLNEIDCEVTFV